MYQQITASMRTTTKKSNVDKNSKTNLNAQAVE